MNRSTPSGWRTSLGDGSAIRTSRSTRCSSPLSGPRSVSVFVIFLAGLQNVSKDLLEAATVDGANVWQRFWNVTVPQMASVINVVIALLLIGGFSVFDIIFVMTGGGPANATEVLATYTYKEAFTQNNVGYASTLSVVITVISLIASVTFIRLRERQEA